MTSDEEAVFSRELIALNSYAKGFARHLLGVNSSLGEDIAQEAMTKAWKSRHQYNPGSNMKAWLFTIIRHEVFSYKRRAWREEYCGDDGIQSFIEKRGVSLRPQEWHLFFKECSKAFATLTKEHQQALLLVGASGYSYAEAAALEKVPEGTIKSRVTRARKILFNLTGFEPGELRGQSKTNRDFERRRKNKEATKAA